MAITIGGSSISTSSLNQAQQNRQSTMEKLSSGQRINSAKDDSAGLSISDRFTSQLFSINQASRNANDGISLTQVADSALSESTSMLQRMRELAVQSGNGIYNYADRSAMNAEFSQLQNELDRIAETTTFNDQQLLNGDMSSSGATFQVGTTDGEQINIQISDASAESLGVEDLSIADQDGAEMALAAIDEALGSVSEQRAGLGAAQSQFESAIETLNIEGQNISAARSRISDADIAKEASEATKYSILEKAGVALQAQAQLSAQNVLKLLG